MSVVVPPSNIISGVDVEERSFTWTIENFPIWRTRKALVESQAFPFTAGEVTGHPSQWTVSLAAEAKQGANRWIGIFIKPESPNATDPSFKASHLRFRFAIRNKEGEIIKDEESTLVHIATKHMEGRGTGFDKFIDAEDAKLRGEESLVIQISVKLYTPSQAKLASSLEAIKERFQGTFMENWRKDFAGLLEIPEACKNIKIISSDEKEFSMQKGILAARSDVFAAMLRSDMTEANSGVIKLTDISGKAVKLLLNFMKTGILLPEWGEKDIIVELTNAAAEYQIKDLLQFFDVAIGKVCRLENVLELAILARRLSLKVAEEELMMFVRKDGVSSLDSLIQMCNAELTGIDGTDGIDSEPTPGGAAKKRKRN